LTANIFFDGTGGAKAPTKILLKNKNMKYKCSRNKKSAEENEEKYIKASSH
jgi:hypothetical protein